MDSDKSREENGVDARKEFCRSDERLKFIAQRFSGDTTMSVALNYRESPATTGTSGTSRADLRAFDLSRCPHRTVAPQSKQLRNSIRVLVLDDRPTNKLQTIRLENRGHARIFGTIYGNT